MDSSSSRKKAPAWFAATKAFEAPSRWRATLQLIDTLGPFLTIGVAAAFLSRAGVPWYVLSALAIFGGLFMVRLFILFHDCCHGSFWAGRKAHGTHHAHNGNLDQRGVGDVWTLTLEEYRRASPGRRFQYRLYRNPVFLFLFSPPLLFLLLQRLPDKGASRSELCGVHVTTVAVLAMLGSVGWLAGREFLLAYALPMTYVATVAGVWLFYVQHQFDPGYWEHEDRWDPYTAALDGSSFYRLPAWAQWFSGNIGFHHIHHLRPHIPNYRLQACLRAVPELQLLHPLTVWASLKGLTLHLWDEKAQRLLSFHQAAHA